MVKKRGFTLIELLVVVAIIALLLSIVMPALKKAKKLSRRITCMSNVRSFELAFSVYAAENDDRMIELYFADEGKFWTEKLRDYYNADELRLCPEAVKLSSPDTEFVHDALGISNYGDPYRAWYHINNATGEVFAGSYGTNGWAHEAFAESQTWGYDIKDHWGKMNAKKASQVPVMLDCTWVSGYPLDTDLPLPPDQYYNYWSGAYNYGQMNRYCFNRHGGFINVSFMDGSVDQIHVEELWTLKWHRSFIPRYDIAIDWNKR